MLLRGTYCCVALYSDINCRSIVPSRSHIVVYVPSNISDRARLVLT